MNTSHLTPFNGSNYQHDRDAPRLTDQMERVFNALSDKQWHTLEEIAAITGDPTPSISAQIRHLRKARFGSWEIEKRYHGNGLYAYRLTGEKIWYEGDKQDYTEPLPPAALELILAAQSESARLRCLLGEAFYHLDYRSLSAACNDSLPDRISVELWPKDLTETS